MFKKTIGLKREPKDFFMDMPAVFDGERAIEVVWRFADDPIRKLLERLAIRDHYLRVFETRLSDLGPTGDYEGMKSDLLPEKRPSLADTLEDVFLKAIRKGMMKKSPTESASETAAQRRFAELSVRDVPRVIVDFPIRGVPKEKNFPIELSDPSRKYLAGRPVPGQKPGSVFHVVRKLQTQAASVRVFAARELHEMIVRYLGPSDVQACVESVITRLKVTV